MSAAARKGLLSASEVEIEAADDVGAAVFQHRDGGFGFADPLVTFDRKAAKTRGVELLKASGACTLA